MRLFYLLLVLLLSPTSLYLIAADWVVEGSSEVSKDQLGETRIKVSPNKIYITAWYWVQREDLLSQPESASHDQQVIPITDLVIPRKVREFYEATKPARFKKSAAKAEIQSGLPAKYLVVSITEAGMGNRLRVIGSAEIMAGLTNRQLVVYWPVNIHLPGRWQDFFKRPLVMFENSGLSELGYSFERITSAQPNDPLIRNLGLKNNPAAQHGVLPYLADYREPIVYFESTLSFTPYKMTRGDWLEKRSAFYEQLSPNEWIKQEVKVFADKNKFDEYYMVGVHYRGWQMGESDNNEKLTNDPSNKYIQEFIDAMKKELLRPDSKTDNKPVAFFLAADNQSAKDAIMKNDLFSGRIFTRSDEIERNTVRGQESALVDFYLLGLTNFIIGTSGSSFSKEAAFLTKQRKKFSVGDDPYHNRKN
ncbi:MAG TPA: hypothetical protein VEL47_07360 [Myxococcota bacterium]|nr:hypothetical protein [Myxococcota bacterium]